VSTPTQVRRPWRATARTVFAAIVGLAAMWGLLVEAAGLDADGRWVAASVAVMGGVTRVMAVPQVNEWLQRFLPWLAAEPKFKAQPNTWGGGNTFGPKYEGPTFTPVAEWKEGAPPDED
jgi:hypothetical protein